MLAVSLGNSVHDLADISNSSVLFFIPRVEGQSLRFKQRVSNSTCVPATTDKIDFINTEYIPILSVPPNIDGIFTWCRVIVNTVPDFEGSYASPSSTTRYYLLFTSREDFNGENSTQQEIQFVPLPQRPFDEWTLEMGMLEPPLTLQDIPLNSIARITSFKQYSVATSTRFVKLLARTRILYGAGPLFGSGKILRRSDGNICLRGTGEIEGGVGMFRRLAGNDFPSDGNIEVSFLGGSDASLSVWLSAAPLRIEPEGLPFTSGSSFCEYCGFIEPPQSTVDAVEDNSVLHIDFAEKDDGGAIILCAWASNLVKLYEFPWLSDETQTEESTGAVQLPILLQWSLVDGISASLIQPSYNRAYVADRSGMSLCSFTAYCLG
jgi:hypothetical protein